MSSPDDALATAAGSSRSRRAALDVRVDRRVELAEGVVSLELVPVDGAPLPKWDCGAHIDLYLNGGLRQYSLCGDPADTERYQIAVLLQPDGRGGSSTVHRDLHHGASLRIGRPRNHFKLVDAPGYCFIAGGIGITPIRAMICEAERRNKTWTLHYGGRHRTSMAFADDLSVHGDRVHVLPEDEAGLLPLRTIIEALPDGHVVYCCGPEPLLEAIERVTQGHAGVELHIERFAPPLPKHLPGDFAFDVVCAESAVTVHVEAQQTVLDALLAAGIDASFDCCEGTCGTCELEVVDGEVDHRDAILTGEERAASQLIFPCVSRSKTACLTLDV